MKLKIARENAGSLSRTSKMRGCSTGLPATSCHIGMGLAGESGSVCNGCYALSGNYQYPSVKKAQAKRLAGIRHPAWVESMVTLIAHYSGDYFRWHDSGDIQSVEHFARIVQIAELLSNTKFWLPTRELFKIRQFKGTIPPNLCIRVSALMIDSCPPNYTTLPTSTVHTGNTHHGLECQAYKRDGKCGSCVACYSNNVANVSYRKH